MKLSLKKGFSFGLTSGIITTLGLIIGLESSTNSTTIVISGILVIAITDALSDALGMHISEESEFSHTEKEIWESTIMTFISKFIVALTFLVPVLLLPLYPAVIASIIWGLTLIVIFSFYIAKKQRISSKEVVLEHLIIAIFVIIATHYIGDFAGSLK